MIKQKIAIIGGIFSLMFFQTNAYADWDLDKVDLKVLDVNIISANGSDILQIEFSLTNSGDMPVFLRAKDVLDLRTFDRIAHENQARRQAANFDFSYAYSLPNTECKKLDFTVNRGESIRSTICFEISEPHYRPLKLDDSVEYYLVLSDRDANSCPACKKMRILETINAQILPSWIKNNARWWSEGTIDDYTYAKGLEFLIKERIIKIPPNTYGLEKTTQIPNWIKDIARWWSEGQVSDNDYLNAIQYMIERGIISIRNSV
ncbi:MAG: hypothetical protein ACREAK_10970 [Nitrosarchaeum sp.]